MVELLGRSDRQAVVDVLVAAFSDYPVMRYVVGQDSLDYVAGVRALIGGYTDVRLQHRWPVLGCRDLHGRLVAASLVRLRVWWRIRR